MAQYIAKEIKCATTNASQASVTGLAQTNKNCLVGKDGGWCRSYLDFDFSGISDDVVVTSAYLKFYVFARDSIYMNYADSMGYVYLGKMTSLWNESELNWSNKPSQIKRQTVKVPSTGIITIDITTIVQDWFTNPSTRYGIELHHKKISAISGSTAEFGNGDFWRVCRASDCSRGVRCNVAYIQRSIPYDVYRTIISPVMFDFPFAAIRLWGEGNLHISDEVPLPF